MKNSKLLGVMVGLQSLVLLGQWAGPTLVSTARADAQISNPGERQIAMIDELRALNSKMDRLLGMLQGGEVQIRVAKPDEASKAEAENK